MAEARDRYLPVRKDDILSALAQQRAFADHHVYTPREAAELEQAALGSGADALLCTEKDAWNLRNIQFTALPTFACRISFDLPDGFWTALSGAVQRGKGSERR